ncbi:MAG: GNAT family N-acetyltransferase [Pseudomonadota bacterium]
MTRALEFHRLTEGDGTGLVLALGDPEVTGPSNLPFDDFRAAEVFVSARLSEHSRGECEAYVLRIDGSIVGYAALYLREGEIEPVFAVVPSLWGAGLGGLALDFLIKRADLSAEGRHLMARCRPDNGRAAALLRSRGFRPSPVSDADSHRFVRSRSRRSVAC